MEPVLLAGERRSSDDDPSPQMHDLVALVSALARRNRCWTDSEAALLLEGCVSRMKGGSFVNLRRVTAWVPLHFNQPSSVLHCLDAEPPDGVEIVRILPDVGSQKHVFLVRWKAATEEFILKREFWPDATGRGDMESSRLAHPNIVKTVPLRNGRGELFFLERRLGDVLDDSWRADGVEEGARLLHDVSSAIKYVHEKGWVHADVKPANIGKDDGRFILLDFGNCRPTGELRDESYITGSLRTRAPELLSGEGYLDPPKVDVWALGATLFNAFIGRYPLIAVGDRVPGVASPVERTNYAGILRRRVEREWEGWVDLNGIPPQLREILRLMLERDPRNRMSSAATVEMAKHLLTGRR